MKIKKWIAYFTLKNKDLYYKLNLIFGLLFLFPIVGFIFFGIKYDILNDRYTPVFFLGVLVFSFLGFTMLRKVFDQINHISNKLYHKSLSDRPDQRLPSKINELQKIISSFQAIEHQFDTTSRKLKKRASEISVLKELSELYYITFDPEEILAITLERALNLVHSDIGSILMLEDTDPKQFTIKTSIGLDEHVKVNDTIDFETSPAKYAILNKSPLLVRDIEQDPRFSRINRPQYATKSFICMPIKTSHKVVGVMTVSRKKDKTAFSEEEIDILTPLVNHAAFTYHNLRIIAANKHLHKKLHTVDITLKNINSAAKFEDQTNLILHEMRRFAEFDLALLLLIDPKQTGILTLEQYSSTEPVALEKGDCFPYRDTVLEDVIDMGRVVTVTGSELKACDFEKLLPHVDGNTSHLFFPVKTSGSVKGLLALFAVDENCDLQITEMLTAGLNLALDRDQLSSAVIKRNRELESIKQLGSALASSTFDLSQVLKYTIDMIQIIMDTEAGFIFLMENNQLSCVESYGGPDTDQATPVQLRLGQGIAGQVAARGEALVVNDMEASRHFSTAMDQMIHFKTHSALCVPMISQGRVLGVVEVRNKRNGAFSNDDLDLMQSIGSSVSIAMENARLYQETLSMAEHERDIRRMFQKFVPKEIVEQIINGQASQRPISEEMKTVTLLNIDLRGFSVLAKEIGPQKTVSLLNSFFSIMGEIVFKHHGIVDKYLGDGFLAIFGAPVTRTYDADNALAAALEMKASIEAVNACFLQELGARVDMGISVHSGEVVIGNIGFDRKMDYTVIGDAVNGVFRLQELVKKYPNQILASESTLRAAQSRYEVASIESPPDIDPTLEGLQLYQLVGPVSS